MMKNIAIIIILLSITSYAEVITSYNTTPAYDTTTQFMANASAATVISTMLGVNETCISPLGSSTTLSVTNSSDLWWGDIYLNESGLWNCTAEAYNSTESESNYSEYTISCPSDRPVEYINMCYVIITLTLDTSLEYYDIGDNVTLWANLTNSTMTSSLYVYSSDNSTLPFQYSILKGEWYVYYTVKQQQEVLIVQSFTSTGVATGIGEFTLTYNPDPPTLSMWEMWSADLGKYIFLIILAFVAIVIIITMGPMVVSIIIQRQG